MSAKAQGMFIQARLLHLAQAAFRAGFILTRYKGFPQRRWWRKEKQLVFSLRHQCRQRENSF